MYIFETQYRGGGIACPVTWIRYTCRKKATGVIVESMFARQLIRALLSYSTNIFDFFPHDHTGLLLRDHDQDGDKDERSTTEKRGVTGVGLSRI